MVNIDSFDKEEDNATMIRRVYVDLDNTAIPTKGLPSGFFVHASRFRDLAHELTARGIPVKLCTGRDRNSVEMATRALGLFTNQFFVIEDGVARFNPTTGALVLNPALTPEILSSFEHVHREWKPKILEMFPDLWEYLGNQVVVNFELRHGVTTHVEVFYDKIKEEMRHLEEQGLLAISCSGFSVDIKPVGKDGVPIDKASGIRWDTAEEGSLLSDSLYIGDSMGDENAVRTTGHAACVANAKQDFKAVIRDLRGHESDYPYMEGVVDAIEQLVLGRKP